MSEREILFRGKSTGDHNVQGNWVEGNLICIDDPEHIISDEGIARYIGDRQGIKNYRVVPSTVGQFTGLTDRNGTKIFEGDIVVDDDCNKGMIKYSTYECGLLIDFWGTEENIYRNTDDIKIIGNIHDNPELLEGE